MPVERFYNVKTLKIGATTTYTGIKSVSYRETITRIAGMGDADKGVTFQARGASDNEVTIAIQDPIQAQAIRDAAPGDLTFNAMSGPGLHEKSVTIKTFQAFNRAGHDEHNKLNELTVSGHGYNPDGSGVVITEIDASTTD